MLRLRDKGGPGAGTWAPGDALIEVLPDSRFAREGDAIFIEMPISLTEAVLGASFRLPTPTSEETMAVPKGSNTGTKLRLRGKGAPSRDGGCGDEYAKLKIVLPSPSDPDLEAFVSGCEAGKAFDQAGRFRMRGLKTTTLLRAPSSTQQALFCDAYRPTSPEPKCCRRRADDEVAVAEKDRETALK